MDSVTSRLLVAAQNCITSLESAIHDTAQPSDYVAHTEDHSTDELSRDYMIEAISAALVFIDTIHAQAVSAAKTPQGIPEGTRLASAQQAVQADDLLHRLFHTRHVLEVARGDYGPQGIPDAVAILVEG